MSGGARPARPARAARARTSVAPSRCTIGAQKATASSLEMNSQTPSEAARMKRSSSVSACSLSSGSAITPSGATRWSPIERAIASPGSRMLESTHTRAGLRGGGEGEEGRA